MDKIAELDSLYSEFMRHLPELIPDGVLAIDLKVLQKLELLSGDDIHMASSSLTRFFHVVESKEKITLYNDQFVTWIVPEKVNDQAETLVLIAIEHAEKPHLEMAFSLAGIYNTSRLVLRVLEKFLSEIQENEDLISRFEENP
jgi:hypothetical protein